MRTTTIAERRNRVWPYLEIARVDHWFKNSFMLLGLLLACFYKPEVLRWQSIAPLAAAVLATCLIASSNYVLNELLDAPRDALHPLKRARPAAAGLVRADIGYVEWFTLAVAGIALALIVNRSFALAAVALWMMGLVYNVPPLRLKEWPYLDVLTESANNPIRLWLGWFAIVSDRVPPLSLTLAYWMVGAFFMGAKRLAEYRQLANPALAASYRNAFRFYTEERLLVSLFFYSTACALFTGIFIVRFHVELVLFVPAAAALFSHYLTMTLRPNSPVQHPERLLRERKFLIYAAVSIAMFVTLMFTQIPVLYDWFNVQPTTLDRVEPLWTIGRSGP
jgi:decaprenyl-phosphate phosphoribosyltransferase